MSDRRLVAGVLQERLHRLWENPETGQRKHTFGYVAEHLPISVTRQHLSDIYHGRVTSPRMDVLQALAVFFDVDASFLLARRSTDLDATAVGGTPADATRPLQPAAAQLLDAYTRLDLAGRRAVDELAATLDAQHLRTSGPESRRAIADSESANAKTRGRRPVPRADLLAAADDLLAAADAPEAVTLEAIASAAGVGKATVCRGFGGRDGVIEALMDAQFAAVRTMAQHLRSEPHENPELQLREFLNTVLTYTLRTRHLVRARESATNHTGRYQCMRSTLRDLIPSTGHPVSGVGGVVDVDFVAQVLIAALHHDAVDQLLASGYTPEDIQCLLAKLAKSWSSTGEGPVREDRADSRRAGSVVSLG